MTLAKIACCNKIANQPEEGKYPHICSCPTIALVGTTLRYNVIMRGWYEGDDPSRGINRSVPWKTFRNYSISPESGYSTFQTAIEDCNGVSYRSDDAFVSGSFNSYVEDDGSFTETGSNIFPVTWIEKFCSGPFGDPPNSVVTIDSSYNSTETKATYRNGFSPQNPASLAWDSSLQYWESFDPGMRVEHTLSDEDTELLAEKRAFFTNPASVSDNRSDPVWSDPEDPAWKTPDSSTSGINSYWEVRSASSTQVSWDRQFLYYNFLCENLFVGFDYKITPKIQRRTITTESTGAYEDVAVTPITFTATSSTQTVGGDEYAGAYFLLDNVRGWEYVITQIALERA